MCGNAKEDCPSFSDVLPPNFLAVFTWYELNPHIILNSEVKVGSLSKPEN